MIRMRNPNEFPDKPMIRSLLILVGILVGSAMSLWLAPVTLAQSAEQLRQLGLDYRAQERYPEAIAALEKAVTLEPQNISGRVLLGWTQHRAGMTEAAAVTLLDTFYRNPFDVPNLNALGIVYLVDNRLSQAVAAHAWSVVLKPDNKIGYYNLSLSMERLGNYEWAQSAAQEAHKLEPTNPHPLIALALAQWQSGERNQARQSWQRAIALNGSYGTAAGLPSLKTAGFSPDQISRLTPLLQP